VNERHPSEASRPCATLAGVQAEGLVEVPGGRVFYRRFGGGDATPVLLLHGGPGAAAYYLEPLAEALAHARPAVVYDQLGCGRSDIPDDPSLWTVDRAVAELDQVRAALGLERCHLLGQSWGGWLAIEYMCRGPRGIAGLVLASTSAGIPEFVSGARALIAALPEPHATVLREGAERGEYDSPEYLAAVDVFYRRHLCRADPWPEPLQKSSDQMEGNQVYATMNGPTEFDVIGSLREWDRTADLGTIAAPTLVTCGAYDELTPACSQTIVSGIPGARMELFAESAHVAHLEEPERYNRVVADFLTEVDRGA
jgi:proline-specific peptidase